VSALPWHREALARLLALELVGRSALRALAPGCDGRVHVEEECRIGLQARMHEALQAHHEIARESAPTALVRIGRIAEAVADDPVPGRKRGLDHLRHVFGTRREHEQRFRLGIHLGVEHDLADLLARRRAARLARKHRSRAAQAHLLAKELEMR